MSQRVLRAIVGVSKVAPEKDEEEAMRLEKYFVPDCKIDVTPPGSFMEPRDASHGPDA